MRARHPQGRPAALDALPRVRVAVQPLVPPGAAVPPSALRCGSGRSVAPGAAAPCVAAPRPRGSPDRL